MEKSSGERSGHTVCGEGYVYMGPLTPQQYQIPSKVKEENQYQFKVMLLGDSGVGKWELYFHSIGDDLDGKTCLLVRFNDETFPTGNFLATVGIDYRSKTVALGEKKINLQIFDTAGQERFRSLTHSYIRDADALLLLYDVTSYSSFDNVSSWLTQIKDLTDNQVLIMLIGNKIDKSHRVVSREAGERLAQDNQIHFLETSAKTGQNVELAFMTTAQDLLDKKLQKDQVSLSIHPTVNPTPNSCC